MSVTEEYPELGELGLLPRAGWTFRPIVERGELTCLVGWCRRGVISDSLWIFDRSDCLALRIADGGIAWERTGRLTDCLGELLALPEPGERQWLVKARAPGLWTP